jgi:hypothetical protein
VFAAVERGQFSAEFELRQGPGVFADVGGESDGSVRVGQEQAGRPASAGGLGGDLVQEFGRLEFTDQRGGGVAADAEQPGGAGAGERLVGVVDGAQEPGLVVDAEVGAGLQLRHARHYHLPTEFVHVEDISLDFGGARC